MVHDFKRKQKSLSSRRLLIWLGAAFLLLVWALLVVADVRMYHKRQELNAQIQSLQNKITDTQKSNDRLQRGISQADNPQYIEKVAREELDLQKPGEKVVSFVQNQNQQPMPGATPPNFLQSWLGWVGGWFKK